MYTPKINKKVEYRTGLIGEFTIELETLETEKGKLIDKLADAENKSDFKKAASLEFDISLQDTAIEKLENAIENVKAKTTISKEEIESEFQIFATERRAQSKKLESLAEKSLRAYENSLNDIVEFNRESRVMGANWDKLLNSHHKDENGFWKSATFDVSGVSILYTRFAEKLTSSI